MSIKVMQRVWDHAKASGTDLVILLALADRADEDGVAWPGINYLCQKARVKERATQTIIRKLEARGELHIETGHGRKNTNYYIVVSGLTAEQIAQTLVDRLEYTPEEAAEIGAHYAEKMQSVAPFNEEEKGAKLMQKGAKLRTKGAKPRQKKVQHNAPDPSVNPSINPLSLSGSDGGQKLHDILSVEYQAKNRRPPSNFKTVEMKTKWLTECEARLAPAELEKAIRAALALSITDLPRLVAYVAKWGTQPRPTYAGSANGKAKPTTAEIKPSAAKQDNTRGVYI